MLEREWVFRVTLQTSSGESVGVVGSCPELGSWNHENGVLLTKCSSNAAPDKLVIIIFLSGLYILYLFIFGFCITGRRFGRVKLSWGKTTILLSAILRALQWIMLAVLISMEGPEIWSWDAGKQIYYLDLSNLVVCNYKKRIQQSLTNLLNLKLYRAILLCSSISLVLSTGRLKSIEAG